jgi:hypothetical protein
MSIAIQPNVISKNSSPREFSGYTIEAHTIKNAQMGRAKIWIATLTRLCHGEI